MNEDMFFEGFKECSIEQGEFFKSILTLTMSKTIVEIGVAYGTTTKYLCEGVLKHNGVVYGFDLWSPHGENLQYQQLSSKQKVEDYLLSEGLTNYKLTQIDTKSEEFNKIIENLPPIDFVFIDGDHSYLGIKNDFDKVYNKLSNTGIIAFHDTLRIDGCREFIIDLRTKYNDGSFDILDFPFGNKDKRAGISILMKRSFHDIGIEIDEICGSISSPEEIYNKEKNYIIQNKKI